MNEYEVPDVVPDPPYKRNGLKLCHGECNRELPATPDHFDRDASKEDGLYTVCKQCKSARRQQNEHRKIMDRVKELDDRSVNLLFGISSEGSDVPHSAEIFQKLLQVFGGIHGFAQHYMANFLMSKPGSAIRQKMLDSIIRLGLKVTETGAANLPIDLMEDADVERELTRRAQKIIGIVGPDGERTDHEVIDVDRTDQASGGTG